mmetsp:Transcript_8406/g.16897  ORF Transcript_8406/g.16897 Transcript_8406/m.16897 type:complete len:298 (+) Transcript_8406:34-927(+)
MNFSLSCCNDEQTFFLVTFSLYLVAARILWYSKLLKPFKLWTTFMHEFSHALAAWATCNKVTGIEVNENEGGLTHWSGVQKRMRCSSHFVLPAGYLGSTAWGVAIILSCVEPLWAQVMGCVLVAALLLCLLYALCGKTKEQRMPLIMVSVGFGLWLGGLTAFSIYDGATGWDLGLKASLLLVGTLNTLYGTVDIYDDTLVRTDSRSDAYKCAQLYPCWFPKCVGFTWLLLAVLAFAAAVFGFLALSESDDASLSWWIYLPGPVALGVAVLVRILEMLKGGCSKCSFRGLVSPTSMSV